MLERPEVTAIPFGELLSNRVMWGIIIGSFCYNYFNYVCLTWLPAYFAERRALSLSSTGWFTGFSLWGFAIVATAGSFWADRIIQNRRDPIMVRNMWANLAFLLLGMGSYVFLVRRKYAPGVKTSPPV